MRRFDSKHPYRTLWLLFSNPASTLFGAVALFVVKQSPSIVLPLAIGGVVDCLTPVRPGSWEKVLWIAGGYMLLLGQHPLTQRLFTRRVSRAIRHMQHDLRRVVVERLLVLSTAFHAEKHSVVLQTKILRDADDIASLCRHLMNSGLNGLVTLIYVTGLSLAREPLLACYFAVTVPLGVAILKTFNSRLARQFETMREDTEQMNATVGEMLHMLPVTRAHGVEAEQARGAFTSFERIRRQGIRVDELTDLFSSSSWVAFNLLQFACLIFSAWLVKNGRISVGDAVMYSASFGMLVTAVQQLLSVFPSMVQGAGAIGSIAAVIDAADVDHPVGRTRARDPLLGEIVFDRVGFRYPHQREAALSDVSLTLGPAETVAVVGQSGSGKSTLMNLAIGLLRPTSGRVMLDGVDLRDLDLPWFRQRIGVVPQCTLLFSGTIRENITFGLGNLSDAELWEILDHAHLAGVVSSLPMGLDTALGSAGARLSEGQKQRLAIARALARKPQVVLMDEATSALDSESEQLVQGALTRLTAGRTTIIVAHRLSTIRSANRVVVLEAGRVADMGTPAELSMRAGYFQRVMRMQGLGLEEARPDSVEVAG